MTAATQGSTRAARSTSSTATAERRLRARRPDPGARLGRDRDRDGTCAPVDNLAGPGQGEKLPLLAGAGIVPPIVPVSVWRIGRLGIASFPSEITKQMGERITELAGRTSAARWTRSSIAGLTNGYISYTATPEEYGACSYEGSFTLFGRQQGYAWLGSRLEPARALCWRRRPATGAPAPPNRRHRHDRRPRRGPRPTPARPVASPRTSCATAARSSVGGAATRRSTRRAAGVRHPRAPDARGRWSTFATDDAFDDTTQREAADVWTETFQFDACCAARDLPVPRDGPRRPR